jgi:hypothetical protein
MLSHFKYWVFFLIVIISKTTNKIYWSIKNSSNAKKIFHDIENHRKKICHILNFKNKTFYWNHTISFVKNESKLNLKDSEIIKYYFIIYFFLFIFYLIKAEGVGHSISSDSFLFNLLPPDKLLPPVKR